MSFADLLNEFRRDNWKEGFYKAYILCDWRMPSGIKLPEPNHDWNSFAIDELKVGSWAICKLKDQNGNLFSQYFAEKDRLGIRNVLVRVMIVDTSTSAVLVLYQDYHNLQKLSIWVPVVSLTPTEITLRSPASSYSREQIMDEFVEASNDIIALSAKQTLLSFFSLHGTQ